MNRLAKNLKLIRKEKWRLSQDRFSTIMDSTRSKINSYENGGVEPSIAFVIKLQAYTNLSVQEIFYTELTYDQIPPYPLEGGQANKEAFGSNESASDLTDLEKLLKIQKGVQQQLSDLQEHVLNILDLIKNKKT